MVIHRYYSFDTSIKVSSSSSSMKFRIFVFFLLGYSGAYDSEQATLIYSCHHVFILTSIFLDRFWREIRISKKPYIPVSKTYRPKNVSLTFKWSQVFFIHMLYFEYAQNAAELPFSRENGSKMQLKTNLSVKTRSETGLVSELLGGVINSSTIKIFHLFWNLLSFFLLNSYLGCVFLLIHGLDLFNCFLHHHLSDHI